VKRLILLICILLGAATANYFAASPEKKQVRETLDQFPKILGGWEMISDTKLDYTVIENLKVDDYIMRTYRDKAGNIIGLYVGYFYTQREGKQIHSPRLCLPGAGWGIQEKKVYPLQVAGDEQPYNVNYFVMDKGGEEKQLYLWWYQARGRIYANEYLNKVYIIWDAFTRNRTDGALVRINSPIMNGDVDSAQKIEVEFISLFFDQLNSFIPQ
jgi:EpsI family protein